MKTEDILLIEIKYKTLSSKIVWYVKPVSFCILWFFIRCVVRIVVSGHFFNSSLVACTLRLCRLSSHTFVSSLRIFAGRSQMLDASNYDCWLCICNVAPMRSGITHTRERARGKVRNFMNQSTSLDIENGELISACSLLEAT